MPILSSSSDWAAEIPPLGFGCCPMGGHGWGKVDEDQLLEAVRVALDQGVRLFDTADIYGLGASELLLGKALRGHRDRVVVATKFGVRFHQGKNRYDTSVEWIKEAVDASLQRLGIDCIDLYQMHYWDGKTPLQEIVATLEALIVRGKIRAYGITNYNPCDRALHSRSTRLASYSHHFSLVHREQEAEILAAQRPPQGPVFFSWGSLGQGVLSGKYRSLEQLDSSDRRQRDVYENFHGHKFVAIQEVLAELRAIAQELRLPGPTQLALRWIIDYIPRSVALVGIKRPEQILDAAHVLRFKLEPAACTRLNELTAQFCQPRTAP